MAPSEELTVIRSIPSFLFFLEAKLYGDHLIVIEQIDRADRKVDCDSNAGEVISNAEAIGGSVDVIFGLLPERVISETPEELQG